MISTPHQQKFLKPLIADLVAPDLDINECQLSNISMDSRTVVQGCLFLALAKQSHSRELHIKQAIEKKAFAVLYDVEQPLTESEIEALEQDQVLAYPVVSLSQHTGLIAARFFEHPSSAFTVIAVTGTNGKTSVTQFIAQALESMNLPCGLIGTMGAGRLNEHELTGMTTPDPVTVQRILANFREQGCQYVAMEASSHALSQGRLNNVDVDIAVFTNLTRDHLDYHKSMQAYAEAKQQLFKLEGLKHAVVNMDDTAGQDIINFLDNKINLISYSTKQPEALIAENLQFDRQGMSFSFTLNNERGSVSVPIIGLFNVENILASIAVFAAIGIDGKQTESAINQCKPVAGRMQMYGDVDQVKVIIDYAHTPDALEQALKTLRTHLPPQGKLWCVFGCGGDRDSGKRPLMGAIAENLADFVVVTDDNPRTESSQTIIDDILAGCEHPEDIIVVPDRDIAIGHAISHAAADDFVLVAGKGHETYQDVNHVKYPFSDAEVVSQCLAASYQIKNLLRAYG